MIRIIENINIDPILDEYQKIEKNIIWTEFGHQSKQAGLQSRLGRNPWTDAVGRSKGADMIFDQINPFFIGTLFEHLILKYKMKRTRLMWMGDFACYSMHADLTARLHFPLITNKQSYMIFKKGLIEHLPVGSVYWVDTRQEHTAINGSNEQRIHLVGCVPD